MFTNGTTGGTTGTNSGSSNGSTGGNSGTTGGPPPGWTRVSALADELGRSRRWLREWVAANISDSLQERVRRPSGGAAELWVGPAAVVQLRRHFDTGTTGGGAPEAPEAPAEPTAEPPAVVDPGWRAAVDAERARADAAEARSHERLEALDSLRRELDGVRVALDAAQRQAEEAERGRQASDLRLESLRADVWAWVAQVRGLAWWRRLRHLPDPPAALVAHERRLAKPEG